MRLRLAKNQEYVKNNLRHKFMDYTKKYIREELFHLKNNLCECKVNYCYLLKTEKCRNYIKQEAVRPTLSFWWQNLEENSGYWPP